MAVNARKFVVLPFQLLYLFIYTLCIWIQNVVRYFFPGSLKSLVNEIILVTGGGNGIGRELCIALVKEEKNLVIISWDIDEAENSGTIEILKGLGVQRAHAYTVDVSDVEQVAEAAAKVRKEVGNVTMLFNNTGVVKSSKLSWNKDPSDVKKIFDVNVLSHIWTFRQFFPNMLEQRRGHVIEMCSVAGFLSFPMLAEYQATKFAIRGYFESVKADLNLLKINDIHITFVYPSNVNTNMMRTRGTDFRCAKPIVEDLPVLDVIPKLIYGVRRNKNHIYVLGVFHYFHIFRNTIPDKIVSKFKDIVGLSLTDWFSDKEDRRELLQSKNQIKKQFDIIQSELMLQFPSYDEYEY